MSRLLSLIGQLILILAGYAAASLAAGLVVTLLAMAEMGFGADELPEIFAGGLFLSVPFIALFVAYFAFAPALVAILAAELLGKRDWLFHALAGAGVAIAVIARFVVGGETAHSDGRVAAAIVAAGIASGIAYWLVAGRSSGDWRGKPAPISSAPSGS